MRRTGQLLRLLGLLIEFAGVVGVVRERSGRAIPQLRTPGGPVVSAAWVAVALGFVLWLVGTILLAATRPPRRTSL
jgi:hypothetical protein